MLPHQVPTVTIEDLPAHALLLDVREDDEWAAGHIDGAHHVPMHQVPNHVQYAGLGEADTPVVVVCRSGGRSGQVTLWLRQQGIEAYNLDGGMLEWAVQHRPMVGETGEPAQVL